MIRRAAAETEARPTRQRPRRALGFALCSLLLGLAGPLLALATEEPVHAVEHPSGEDHPAKTKRLARPVLTPNLAAKLIQNPLSNIFALPMVDDLVFDADDSGNVGNLFELRPIIAFPVKRWRIVTRWAVPISRVPDATSREGQAHGFGDLDMTTWAIPPQSGPWTFGFGLAKGFDTATSPELSRGGWSMGPAAIAVFEKGPWVASMQASYEASWSVHAQYFSLDSLVAYNFARGWALISNPVVNGVLNGPDGTGWTVPLGGGVQKTWAYRRLGVALSMQGYYNVVRPSRGGRATLKTALTLFIQGVQPRDWLMRRDRDL